MCSRKLRVPRGTTVAEASRMISTTFHDTRLRADETLPTLSPSEDRHATAPKLDVAALSDVGRERQRNEDQFLVAHLGRTVEIDVNFTR